MKLGIVTKIWKRPRLTRLVLDYYAQLEVPGVELVRVAAVSPDEDETLASVTYPAGWRYVAAPNNSLADKGNAAAQVLARYHVDAILNIGSDDLVNADYIRQACEMVEKGIDFISPSGIYFYDTATREALYRESPRIGAGRVISARLLTLTDWNPWQPGGHRPDVDMDRRLSIWGEPAYVPGEVVVDVKTDLNIGTFESIKGKEHRKVDAEWLLDHFPSVAGELLEW